METLEQKRKKIRKELTHELANPVIWYPLSKKEKKKRGIE
jgi:hypothetical protein